MYYMYHCLGLCTAIAKFAQIFVHHMQDALLLAEVVRNDGRFRRQAIDESGEMAKDPSCG